MSHCVRFLFFFFYLPREFVENFLSFMFFNSSKFIWHTLVSILFSPSADLFYDMLLTFSFNPYEAWWHSNLSLSNFVTSFVFYFCHIMIKFVTWMKVLIEIDFTTVENSLICTIRQDWNDDIFLMFNQSSLHIRTEYQPAQQLVFAKQIYI